MNRFDQEQVRTMCDQDDRWSYHLSIMDNLHRSTHNIDVKLGINKLLQVENQDLPWINI